MWEQQPASIDLFQKDSLIYDWNQVSPFTCQFDPPERIELNDETLRDGLQCPSVCFSISPIISEPDIGFSLSSLSTLYRRKPLGTIALCLIQCLKGYIIDITSDINADINNNVTNKLSADSRQSALEHLH